MTVCDINKRQIDAWNSKTSIPIYEPGLYDVVQSAIDKNLFFTTDVDKSIKDADIIFVTVNTPTKQRGIGKRERRQIWRFGSWQRARYRKFATIISSRHLK